MPVEKPTTQYMEALRTAPFRVAIQKDGELTKMSLGHFSYAFGVAFPAYDNATRRYTALIPTTVGNVAVYFGRNSDLPHLVREGFVDAAIVGTDTIREHRLSDQVSQVRQLKDGSCELIYATPFDQRVQPGDATLIATSYPVVARECFDEIGNSKVRIMSLRGSTEMLSTMMALDGVSISGIAEIVATGNTLRANGLVMIPPVLTNFYPVLVANPKSLEDARKRDFFTRL